MGWGMMIRRRSQNVRAEEPMVNATPLKNQYARLVYRLAFLGGGGGGEGCWECYVTRMDVIYLRRLQYLGLWIDCALTMLV